MVVLVLLWVSCEKAEGSHHVYRHLQVSDPNYTVAVTSPALRAAYHFRPPFNWINGTHAFF